MDRRDWQVFHQLGRDVRLYLISIVLIAFSFVGVFGVLLNVYLLRLGYSPPFIGFANAAAQVVSAVTALPAVPLPSAWHCSRLASFHTGLRPARVTSARRCARRSWGRRSVC